MPKPQAIVIGAGIAGLAVAVRLQLKGYAVRVFEANAYPGGKLTAFSQDGFRFDAGPSLFTMPQYVDELFELAGKQPRDYFNYVRKEEVCRYFWDDKTRLTASADAGQFALNVEQALGVPEAVVRRKLAKSRLMYALAGKTFLEKPLHKLSTWLTTDVFRAMFRLRQLAVFSTMHNDNQHILKHPKLVQLFDRYATYNGSDPYRAPGVLNIIPHLEYGIGTFIPVNGMHDISLSIHRLAEELGVQFSFGEIVHKIYVEEGKVTGVTTDKGNVFAEVVVSNMDVVPTYHKLLPTQRAPQRTFSQERSSSGLVFYWGMKASFAELGLHNIFFSEDYEKEFSDLFSGVVPSADPTIYVNITSKDVSADAPAGCENWFVMVNVPANTGQDWDALIPAYKTVILNKLNKQLNVKLEESIVCESVLSPVDIERNTSSMGGSLYGSSSNSRFAAFLRHKNESATLKGMYFCGGSVHPGGGIPLCLLSARITASLIKTPL